MGDNEELEDVPQDEEPVIEKPGLDYEELDPETGFKKIDWQIWNAFTAGVLEKPEDEREEPEEWAENYATESNIQNTRVLAVVKLGIYAGARDEYNQRVGEGKAIYPNGDMYEGQYWEGKKNGKGMYIYKSSPVSEVDKLLKQLKQAKPEEESLSDFVNRAAKTLAIGTEIVRAALEHGFNPCYKGDFLNNLRHGKGVMKNKDASVYKGDWKDGKRSGDGVYYFLNGDVFSGRWENGLKHGLGCYVFANNKGQYSGLWENGIFKEGQWTMSDGNIYEGKFDAKNRPSDPMGAVKFRAFDLVQQGEYHRGKWSPSDALVRGADYAQAMTPTTFHQSQIQNTSLQSPSAVSPTA